MTVKRFVSWLVTWWWLRPSRPEALSCVALPAAPLTPPWSKIDRENWHRIITSETGQRVLARARAVHYHTLRAASQDHFHAAQSAHAARGFEEAIIWLESLSISSAPDATGATTIGGTGESQPNETPELTEARELREFVDRYSP